MFISMDIDRNNLEGVPHKTRITKDKPTMLPNTTRNGIGVPEVEILPSFWFVELPGGM